MASITAASFLPRVQGSVRPQASGRVSAVRSVSIRKQLSGAQLKSQPARAVSRTASGARVFASAEASKGALVMPLTHDQLESNYTALVLGWAGSGWLRSAYLGQRDRTRQPAATLPLLGFLSSPGLGYGSSCVLFRQSM